MSKISTYEVAPVPKLSDKLIGTSVGGEIEDITYNFTLLELLELFLPVIPANNLQGVLDYGNTATQDINLFGTITTTNLEVTDTANLFITYLNEETHIVGSLFDSADSVGTSGQVLTSTGEGVEWFTLPPIFTPNLQQVLEEGNTADLDIILDADLEAINITAETANITTQLSIQGVVVDYNESAGTAGQVLESTVTGVQWTNLPVYSATSPLLFNSGTNAFSIQVANSTQGGYLTANDWVTFDGKQNAGAYITALTGEATATGPGSVPITLNNASVIAKVLTGLNVTGGSISATDSILTAFGKVQNQINGLMGGVQYQGVWNAATNTPTLTSSVGTQGHYYIVNVAGTTNLNGITDWQVGDWAIFSGGAWQKVDNTDSVTSVNGQTGAVSLTTDNIPEGTTNLYFLDSRARAAVSATSPLSYNNTTGVFSIQQASGTQNGYLSSTDWTTFNNKQNYLSGTGLVKSTAGTITYITDNSSNWNTAYNRSIISASVTGTGTKTLTLNEQDGNTITASWSDADTGLTSVGLTMPSAFSVANSPLTSNGTIGVTGAGTTAQYIRGDGSLATFPSIISEAQNLVTEVYNSSGATLTKGTVVYINGGQGNLPTITKAIATGDPTSAQTYGVVRSDITNMNNGYVVVTGRLADLDTRDYTPGQQLYLSSTTAGAWTPTKQYAPAHLVYVAIVVRAHPTQGVVEVMIQNGYEMDELHNVAAQNPDNNDILQYKTSTNLWTKVAGTTTNIAEGTNLYYLDSRARAALSFTPGSGAYNSTTGVITIPTNTNQLTNGAAFITLGSLSSLAPLSYNNTTGVFSISQAGTSTDGYLSSTDWNTFNNKQPAGSYVPTSRLLSINGTQYDLSADRSWSVGTVTSVAALTLGTSGTDLSSSVANGTTTPVITLNVPTASAANRGALSAADWSTFNTKVGGVTASSPLASSGGQTPNITIQQASGSQNGYLSSTDWTTFNNKQAAGNYITSLTGEATASGPGAAAVTLNNAAVTGKILTGVNITGGSISATDSILTAFGKVQNQINGLVGGSIYQGTWNAATNTPALSSGVGTKGYYYIVSVAGTTNLDGITDWFVGDWAIFDGTAWQQVDNTDAVVSVNGQTGAVSLTTDNIPEGSTNQYFLNSRARAALSFTAGSGAYNSTTGVITIPTNTSQLTNGANFITLASLSGTAPIVYSNTTGAISITQSGTASNGYLSSTDWNTFNNKAPSVVGGYLPLSGGTMTGNINWGQTDNGLTWNFNTDGAYIKFYNTGDADVDSRLEFATIDNNNEYFRWGHVPSGGSFYESMKLVPNSSGNAELTVSGKIIKAGGTTSQFLKANGDVDSTAYQPLLTNPVTGTGTTNYIPKWTSGSAIGNSVIYDDGTNIGIGTINPQRNLDVNGNIRVRGGAIDLSNDFNNQVYSLLNAMYLKVNGTERFTITSTGNAQFSLPNSGNTVSTGNITLLSTATAVNDRLTINFSQTGIASRARAGIGSVAEESSGYAASIAFYTKSGIDGSALDTTNERMRITSGGYVGIGTTTPANLLTLKASVVAPVIDINRSGGGQGKNSGILFRDQLNNEVGAIGTEGQETNDLQILSVGGIRFYTSSNLIITNERMRIFSDGNVGINTGATNAGFKLDVSGTARVTSLITGGGGIKISGGTPYVGGYTKDGLWGATATPNFISTTGNAGSSGGNAFLLGYDDNESGLYSPAYGFPVKSTDGNNTPNRVVRALVMRDTDKNTYPFIVYNNGFIESSTGATFGTLAGTGTRIVVADASGTLSASSALSGYITGSGTTNYVPKFTSGSAIGNSQIFDNGTNVGIGTATPATKLEVRTNSAGVAAARFSDSNYADLVIGFPTAGVASIDFEYGAGGALAFRSGTGKTQRMYLSAAGELSVNLSTGAAAFGNGINIITAPGTYSTGHGGILQFQNEDVITAGIRGVRDPGSWASSLLFYTHTSAVGNTFGTTFTEKARITDDGNLLVNTVTNAGYRLDVSGTGRFTSNLNVGTAANDGFRLDVNGSSRFTFSGRTLQIVSTADAVPAVIRSNNGAISTLSFQGTTSANDFNTRIGCDANDLVAFTNNEIRLRITNGGNVGIGTGVFDLWGFGNYGGGSISQKSIVFGGNTYVGTQVGTNISAINFAVDNTTSSPDIINRIVSVVTSTTNNSESGYLSFFTKSGAVSTASEERIRITSGGNVGINTTNPLAGLQIEKYGSKFDSDVQYNQPAGNVFLSVTGAVANQENWFGMRGSYNSSTGSSNLLLQANYRDINSQAGHYISSKAQGLGVADFIIGKLTTSISVSTPPTLVPQLYITSSGNVGINTIFSGINTASLLTIKASVADGNQIYIVQSNDDRGWRFKAKTDGHFYLQSAYSSGNSDVLKACYDTGNVLIGTTTDVGNRLYVAGTGRFTSMIFGGGGVRISGGNGNTSYTPDGLWAASATPNFIDTTGYGGPYGNSLNASGLLLGYADNGSGLYSPAYGFQVKSTDGAGVPNRVVVAIRIKDTDKNTYPFTIYNNGEISTSGQITATAFYESSDSRLKNLIKDNYRALGIEAIKPKLYIKDGREEVGYFAQDVKDILSTAISVNDAGFLSLSYTQVHTAKIAIIEDEVDVLKRKVSELESKLQKYEA